METERSRWLATSSFSELVSSRFSETNPASKNRWSYKRQYPVLTSDLHTCSCGHTLMHRSPTHKYSDTHEWIPKSNIYFPILLVVSITQTDFCDPPASESQHSLGIWKATWTTVGAEEGTRLARKGERVVIISWVCLSCNLPSSFRGEHISLASWL